MEGIGADGGTAGDGDGGDTGGSRGWRAAMGAPTMRGAIAVFSEGGFDTSSKHKLPTCNPPTGAPGGGPQGDVAVLAAVALVIHHLSAAVAADLGALRVGGRSLAGGGLAEVLGSAGAGLGGDRLGRRDSDGGRADIFEEVGNLRVRGSFSDLAILELTA